MTGFQATPSLHGQQPPSPTPTCGALLPSMSDTPCGTPAAWHIRWNPGDSDTCDAGLACQTHMEALALTTAWYDRHPATPVCSGARPRWGDGRCTEET